MFNVCICFWWMVDSFIDIIILNLLDIILGILASKQPINSRRLTEGTRKRYYVDVDFYCEPSIYGFGTSRLSSGYVNC